MSLDLVCVSLLRFHTVPSLVQHSGVVSGQPIPADRHRCHYVKAKVRVHRYSNGELAVFHGPRKLADYNREGKVIPQNLKQAA